MSISNEDQERRDRATARSIAADAGHGLGRLRQATQSGTTPTPASVGGFFDETGAHIEYKKINSPVNSLDPLGP